MSGKIFISYRRDDVPGDARGVRDALVARFGKAAIFMDVDDLHAGLRFDEELAKALASCDVLIAIIGPRWFQLLADRAESGERDFVREEIAQALQRRIVVIPVRIGREGSMPPLPQPDGLQQDIRDLVYHQKLDISHERFARDITELIDVIAPGRDPVLRKAAARGRRTAAWVLGALVLGAVVVSSASISGYDWRRLLPPPTAGGSSTTSTIEALARSTRQIYDEILRVAKDQTARPQADRLLADGEAALRLGDQAALAAAEADLKRLYTELLSEYVLTIVSRPDESTGIWREPPGGSPARKYYLIVEPVASDGRTMKIPVTNEETGQTIATDRFGVRVPQKVWDAVAADKRDDGILQNTRFGVKRRGTLAVEHLLPFDGGMITKW